MALKRFASNYTGARDPPIPFFGDSMRLKFQKPKQNCQFPQLFSRDVPDVFGSKVSILPYQDPHLQKYNSSGFAALLQLQLFLTKRGKQMIQTVSLSARLNSYSLKSVNMNLFLRDSKPNLGNNKGQVSWLHLTVITPCIFFNASPPIINSPTLRFCIQHRAPLWWTKEVAIIQRFTWFLTYDLWPIIQIHSAMLFNA